MRPITGLNEIIDRYDACIIDLWGVVHDGIMLYRGAKEALALLHEAQKRVFFLSNAPRKAYKAKEGLDYFGVNPAHYQRIITSGQIAYETLKATAPYGRRYYYLGPGKDEDVLDGADFTRTDTPEQAEFILNAGYEYDYQPDAEIEPLLQRLAGLHKPFICINPDLEVVKQDGTRLLCAGSVAARYQALGGEVGFFGKPHPDVYAACIRELNIDKSRILCIGDNPHTDILGANREGMDSLLITGGILMHIPDYRENPAILDQLCAEAGSSPTYSCELFR